jgi:DNA/RNA-binding domain of Phe-tRNA-synthetase-like protein
VLTIDPHPLLDLGAFITEFPAPLGELPASSTLEAARAADWQAPFASSDESRKAIRALLRSGGFKPSGRSKPSSEYLARAAAEEPLRAVNVAVDACNVVSMHSGLPVSVVDAAKLREPLRVGIAEPGSSYVFNPSGQTINVGRLLCLFDAEGPCANAVKDAQRTKTDEATQRTLSVVWGSTALAKRTEQVVAWYRELLEELGARTRSL